jgi:hypothetical protein
MGTENICEVLGEGRQEFWIWAIVYRMGGYKGSEEFQDPGSIWGNPG